MSDSQKQTPHDENCIFCKIIDGQIPADIIDENDRVIVITSLENHPLIISKAHFVDIFEVDEETGAAIMSESIKIAKATKKGLSCDGISVVQSNGAAAGQEVFHYHMHIFPKWNELHEIEKDSDSRRELTDKIKAALI